MSLEGSQPGEPGHRSPKLPDLRRVTDTRTLRALAHPVRIALIETLTVYGPMTATEAGERIGESPTTCSFHLRQLAKYGFVEEAGGGKGRSRPWRITRVGLSIDFADTDPEAEVASMALTRMWRERALARYWTWLETSAAYPRRWRDAATDSEFVFYLTVEEMEQLSEELIALLLPRYVERVSDPSLRPASAVPVEMVLFSWPLEMPADGPPAGGDG